MKFLCSLFLLVTVFKVHASDQRVVVAQSDNYVTYPAIAIDGEGNALALWTDKGLQGIYSAKYDAHKKIWEPAIRLSNNDARSLNDFKPAIQMDNNGNAVAVWSGDQVRGLYYDASSKSGLSLKL